MFMADNQGIIAASARDLVPFQLLRPASVAEAVAALAETDMPPVIYAGGTDMCGDFREGRRVASMLWLKELAELGKINAQSGRLRIGALATLDDIAGAAALDAVPGLAAAIGAIANVRIRMTATIGGNVMARHTAYEAFILFGALNAQLCFASADGEFELTPAELWDHDGLDRALLTEIVIPLEGNPRLDYERSLRPWMTQALAVRDNGARVAIATRLLRPEVIEFDVAAHEDAFTQLPDGFADVMIGNDYARETGAALLARQLRRLGPA